MSLTSSLVLYASIWAIVFFMVLPQGVVTQQEEGDVVPGSPASAPTQAQIKRKMLITTVAALLVWGAVWSVITYRLISLEDIPFLTPPNSR